MKRRVPSMVAALLAAPLAASARPSGGDAQACLAAAALRPRTAFEVVLSSYPTVVERRLGLVEINRLRRTPLPPKVLAHGLSIADYRLRYNVRSEALRWGTGRACAWLGSVVVDLTPEDIRVYIPSEYRTGTCEGDQLLRHEMEHERLSRQAVQDAAARMRSALDRATGLPGPLTPIDAASPEEAYSRLKRMVDEVVRPVYDAFLVDARRRQAALDSPRTYRRLGESCSGWKTQ